MDTEDRDDLITAEDAVEDAKEELREEDSAEAVVEDASEEQEETVAERAKKYGHLSKEEWTAQGKDPDQWKSPEEFDKTGKILEQLYSMRKKLDQRDREIQALVDYQQRTSQREYAKAKQDLEHRLKAAKDDMDMEAVSHYTRELAKVESHEETNQATQLQQQQQAALANFKERNKHWYNDQNGDLMYRAAQIDNELKSIYPTITYDELAQKIEARMQYEFPDRVGGQARARPVVSPSQSSVNKTATNPASATKAFKGLPQDLKDTYNATKRIIESQQGREYTVAEFLKRLKEDGEL